MTEATPSDDHIVACVKEMESLGLDDYGFNLTRTHYQDEALWQAFRKDFDDALERGADNAPKDCADAMKKLGPKVITRILDDVDFDQQRPEGVSAAFQLFCLDSDDEDDNEDEDEADADEPWSHDMGPGIIRSICLMADEASMHSFETTPYVIAVDALLHTGADLGYPGYFKVAIDSLMPTFYAAIGHFDLLQVAAAVDGDGIWRRMKQLQN
ncbi:WW Rsp5 WWP domain [Cordyceps militaris]|uniref:WW Rsp5 WWP domain n=1 Tax=Cordyceps militaris TaxID=73501 RepID=A0A2H4SRZ2_CORMI|nr:WW Rsp5 WWP domain [Cordyceps militaris]